MSMANPTDRVEIITSVQRQRRWTASEKVRMVEETFEPGMTVSLVAWRHGVAPNQLFTWRRLVAQGGLTAGGRADGGLPSLAHQVRELHRLLRKKTLEAEVLKEARLNTEWSGIPSSMPSLQNHRYARLTCTSEHSRRSERIANT